MLDELDFRLHRQAPAHHLILSHQILACQRSALISFQSDARLKMHYSWRLTLTVPFAVCFLRVHKIAPVTFYGMINNKHVKPQGPRRVQQTSQPSRHS